VEFDGHTYTFTYGGEPACEAKPVPMLGTSQSPEWALRSW